MIEGGYSTIDEMERIPIMSASENPINVKLSKGKVSITFNDSGLTELDKKLIEALGDQNISERGSITPAEMVMHAVKLCLIDRRGKESYDILVQSLECVIEADELVEQEELQHSPPSL